MSKKMFGMVTTLLMVLVLFVEHSQAMYFPSVEGEGFSHERIQEAESYAISHPEFFIEEDRDLEMVTQYRELEEVYRRVNNWWQIARSEWGTVGISTALYFTFLDENIATETAIASAVILTPFLMAIGVTRAVQIWTEKLEGEEEEKYLFEGEEVMIAEMGQRIAELGLYYVWAHYIPFIVHSVYPLPPETRYLLRYYPEDYLMGIDEKIEAEAAYVTSRESVVEEESAGFFYYLVFPTEEILFNPTASVSFNEETSELLGRMILTVVTNAGEELIFSFDLSEMR